MFLDILTSFRRKLVPTCPLYENRCTFAPGECVHIPKGPKLRSKFFKKTVALLKRLPIDLGQYEVRYTTKGKQILFSLVPDGHGKTALDLGCRDGYWSRKLSARGYKVVSVDLEPLDPSVIRLDANERFPFSDESFDLVWCTEVIEHVKDPSFTLGEIHRLLRPDGLFLMTTPNSDFWLFRMFRLFGVTPAELQNEDHRQFFSFADMPKLMNACELFGYFFYVLFKKTITKDASLLSPTIVVRWQPAHISQSEPAPALSHPVSVSTLS
jgi:SAM-dependent methyltransferase